MPRQRFSAKRHAASDVLPNEQAEDNQADVLPNEQVEYDQADAYRIMKAKFLRDGFASSQIDSFNDFVNVKIPKCLSEHPPVVVVHEQTDTEHIVEMLDVRFDRPSVREANGENRYVTPHECHIRRLTYQFNMLVTARYMIRQRTSGLVSHSVIFRDKVFDRIPCMKDSEFCTSKVDPEAMMEDEADCGGYFISTGAEKVVVGQEGPRANYPFITEENDGSYKCECRSFNETKFRSTSTLYVTLAPPYVTKSMEERRTCVARITVHIPFVSDPLPLPVAFKLLGVTSTEAMLDYICLRDDPDWFRARALDALLQNMDAVVMTHEFAVTRLAHDRGQAYTGASRKRKDTQEETQAVKRRRKRLENETEYERCQKQVAGLISTEFLPHQGYAAEHVDAKAVLFGNYARKLLLVYYGLQEVDDRDDYMHRRVAMTSTLMTLLVRKHWTMWRRRLASQIRRDLDNGAQFIAVKDLLRANIGGHLQTALSTGDFSMHRGQSNMDGVGQVLSRTEPHAAVSHVNRTSNPMNKDGRAIGPRLQHASCMGIIDPWETPEGESCGLMRNKSPMAGVRVGYPNDVLIDAVLSTGMVDTAGRNVPLALQTNCQVFVSGTLIGTCAAAADPNDLVTLLRARRAVQDLPYDVSIFRTSGAWSTTPRGEIHVNGDPGSFWWPLLRVDRMHQLREMLDHITNEDQLWVALLTQGIVEVINKDEEATAVRVALDHRQLRNSAPGTYTHVVIHPSQICSVFTARGPALEFNQAPRITYNAAMGKQAIGRPMTNRRYRVDTASHELWFPQRALVSTFMDNALSPDGVCSVENPTVAILCSDGWNIEDSLIFHRASIERGLFRSSVVRTTRDVVRGGELEHEELGMPPPECRSRLHADYSKINPATGTAEPGTALDKDDVTVAKFVHMIHRSKETNDKGEVVDVEEDRMRDRSTTVKTREPCVVDDVIFSKTLEGEETVRVRTRSTRVPEVGDKFACLTDGHEVLTTRGWVNISAVTPAHQVACMNPTTLQIVYQTPEHVLRYEGAPLVFRIDAPGVLCQELTGNHRMALWTEDRVELACAQSVLTERASFNVLTTAVEGLVCAEMDTPVTRFVHQFPEHLRPWCYFLMGRLLEHGVAVALGVARVSVLVFGTLWHAVNALGFTHVARDGAVDIGRDDFPAFDVCKPQSLPCFVPRWAMEMPRRNALAYLNGILGRTPDAVRPHEIKEVDRAPYRDQLMQLAMHAGLSPVLLGAQQQYLRVHYNRRPSACVRPSAASVIAHSGPVFCLSVPPHELFCVRRGGTVSWTGNSRYGQKGTIGAIFDTPDMPFNAHSGMIPDILMNPHAIPSRMTIGHIIETLMGKIAALHGEEADGTPFTISENYQEATDSDQIIKDLGERLVEFGFEPTGMEQLVDGRTGQVMSMMTYVGPMSIQKLKHMVLDKFHARSRGPKQMQTMQPVEGRHRDGGQRLGEMEKDCLIAHGATALLQERLLFSSDKANVPVCTRCGQIAQPAKHQSDNLLFQASVHADKPFCHNCLSHDTVCMREMPFAYKLSMQELQALHLTSAFQFEQNAAA